MQQSPISQLGTDGGRPANPYSGTPIRVLTFLHSFEPGGVERIALRLVRRWRELGADASLFLGRTDGDMAHDVGAGLDFVTPTPGRCRSAWWEMPWMIWALPKVIRDQKPDILFCAGNTYAIVAACMRLRFGRKCPPILVKISNDLDRGDKSRLAQVCYHIWLRIKSGLVDHFVSMDESMVEEIGTRLGIGRDRITTIPDPALSEALIARLRSTPPPAPDDAAGRRFVAIGRLAPQKNFALMLRAFQRGAGPADRLTLIGDGPERARLERLAQRLGIGDRVEFRGYVADPVALMRDFHILLLSSNYEGVPAVILEALAARLTVVATDCSRSVGALLGQGALGELVPVGDEAMFANAIARARPGRQNDILSLAQAERFTLERASELYLDVMARLHRDHAARRRPARAPLAVPQPHAAMGS